MPDQPPVFDQFNLVVRDLGASIAFYRRRSTSKRGLRKRPTVVKLESLGLGGSTILAKLSPHRLDDRH